MIVLPSYFCQLFWLLRLFVIIVFIVLKRIWFAVSGVGNRMKIFLLQLLIWFSCTTLRRKNDRSAFDLFALCPGIKSGFFKFCKAHELRIWTLLLTFRVIRADAEDEQNRIFAAIGSSIDKFQCTPPARSRLIVRRNDYDWSSPAVKGGGAAGAVLPAGSAHDDADESGAEAVASPEGEAAAAADAASAAAAGAARAATCKRCPFV